MAAIEMKNIVKQYGDGFPAVNDVSLDIADGEFDDPGRPVGLREVDAAADDRRAGGHHQRRHDHRRQAGQRPGAAGPQPVDGVPELRALPAPDRLREHRLPAAAGQDAGRRGPPPGQRGRRRARAAASTSSASRPTSPAASGSGWRWAARSSGRREAFLFDEPLSNLDAKLRGQMRTEISRLQRRLGITTVYVTHDQTEAMTLGDRVCVLRKGKIQQVASPRELYEQPVNLFVAGFIGSPPMNFLPATLEGNRLKMPFGEIELDETAGQGRRRPRPRCWSASARSTSRTPRWSRRTSGRWARRSAPASTSRSGWATRSTPTSRTRRPRRSPPSCASCPASWTREELRTQAVVSIDSTSRIREGREAEFWLDARKVHIFDPETGENLTRDAEAGAELTRLANQDRVDALEETRGGATSVGAA